MAVDLYPLIQRLPLPLQARCILYAYADMIGSYNDFKVGLSTDVLALLTGISASQAKHWRKQCIDAGFLIDSGEREGKTGQIVRYRIAMLPIEDVNLMLTIRATGADPVPVLAETWAVTGEYLLLDMVDLWRSGQFRTELCVAGVPNILLARGIEPDESVRPTDSLQPGKGVGSPAPLKHESVRPTDALHASKGVGFEGQSGRVSETKRSDSQGKGGGFEGQSGRVPGLFFLDTNVPTVLPTETNGEPTTRTRARDDQTETTEHPKPRALNGHDSPTARQGLNAALLAANSSRVAALASRLENGKTGMQQSGAQPTEATSNANSNEARSKP